LAIENDASRYALSPGPSVQELLAREANPVPAHLGEVAFEFMGSDDVPVASYVSPELARLELERMWSRVWQMACREEEISAVGDHVVYEIGDWSILVIRSSATRIRAFHNVCLHRGRILRERDGHCLKLRCPFHGFTWNLDGELVEVPARWDFPHVENEKFRLPEVKVGTWGGFVFVNLDPASSSLEAYLGGLPAHFRDWALEDKFKAVHVAKVVAMNWKVGVEAFIESLHVEATHPQIMPTTGDTNTQYDIYAGERHWNRMITPFAVSSPQLRPSLSEQEIYDAMAAQGQAMPGTQVPPGTTARALAGEHMRKLVGMMSGRDLENVTDAELLDAIQYFVFPNFFPWGGYFLNIVYRFRPVGADPHRALMEVMMLMPVPPAGPRPAPAVMRLLGENEEWTDAPELGPLGPIFKQDMNNMPFVQRGLRAARKPGITLANYQESRIRHLHKTLSAYLRGESQEK
jgi:phenylpropionate dioxygenase-like ring-hydroxylating dioxygenase large terminal subunit